MEGYKDHQTPARNPLVSDTFSSSSSDDDDNLERESFTQTMPEYLRAKIKESLEAQCSQLAQGELQISKEVSELQKRAREIMDRIDAIK